MLVAAEVLVVVAALIVAALVATAAGATAMAGSILVFSGAIEIAVSIFVAGISAETIGVSVSLTAVALARPFTNCGTSLTKSDTISWVVALASRVDALRTDSILRSP